MAKCFGRFIDRMVQKGEFVDLRPSSKDQIYSHANFVDDSIVLGEATIKNAWDIRNSRDNYGDATSQLIY